MYPNKQNYLNCSKLLEKWSLFLPFIGYKHDMLCNRSIPRHKFGCNYPSIEIITIYQNVRLILK